MIINKPSTTLDGSAPFEEEQKIPPSVSTEQANQPRSRKKVEASPAASDKCPFSGDVQTYLQRFEESDVAHVECPGCGRVWTLSPSGGVLRFKSHDRRKTNTPVTSRRWARGEGEADWDVVEGERN